MSKEIICIVCPKGCHLLVDENLNVQGNSCPRGMAYGKAEVSHPVRMLTSTVKLESRALCRLPVITSHEIPKGRMFDVMKEINRVRVKAPIKCGDVVIKDVLHLGVDIISTRTVLE